MKTIIAGSRYITDPAIAAAPRLWQSLEAT